MGKAVTRCPDAVLWQRLLEGCLPQDDQAALSGHLDACPSCQETLEQLTAGDESWPGPLGSPSDQPTTPDTRLQQLVADLKQGRGEPVRPAPADPSWVFALLAPPETAGHLGRLGRFGVLDVVGQGGMGIVFKAVDSTLNRIVALKTLAPQWAGSATARERFEREVKATAAVRHENVVAVYGVEEHRGLPFMVMEYVEGVSLQQRIEREDLPELEETVRIGAEVAAGLAAAHAEGLIHRDVKPANILFEAGSGRVKLTDFGLARAVDDASLTQSGTIAGTPQFMAPEQARGEPVDHRADLFSLGSVLYTLCAGQPPFHADTTLALLREVSEAKPRPVLELNEAVPDWLADVIETLHAREPERRIQTAEEAERLFHHYLAYLRSPEVVQPPPRLPSRPARDDRSSRRGGGRRRVLVAACALALLVVGVAVGAWGFSRPKGDARGHGAPEAGPEPFAPGAPWPGVVFTNARVNSVLAGESWNYDLEVDYRFAWGGPADATSYILKLGAAPKVFLQRPLAPADLQLDGTLQAKAVVDRTPAGGSLVLSLEAERAVAGGPPEHKLLATFPLRWPGPGVGPGRIGGGPFGPPWRP